jgi:hypothetical protein
MFFGFLLSPAVLQPRLSVKYRFVPRNVIKVVRSEIAKLLKLNLLVWLGLEH